MSSRSTGKTWFRKSIVEYSEEISKSFSEAKARVQQGLEKLKLKNVETFKRIPSIRGSFRGKSSESKKSKSPAVKSKSPKKTATLSRSPSGRSLASTITSTNDINLTYRIRRKPFLTSIEYSSSASESEEPYSDHILFQNPRQKQLTNTSYSFPRISRSRKIENINIVLDKPFPVQSVPAAEQEYTYGNVEPETSKYESCHSNIELKTPTPPKNRTHYESCQSNALESKNQKNDASRRDSKSVSEAMENLRRTIAQFHEKKVSKVNPVRKPPRRRRSRKDPSLVNSPSSSLERYTSPDDGGSDSELAMSTDISYDDSTDDDEPRVLERLPGARADVIVDNDVYWIPRKLFNLPRTSSKLSVQSKSSCASPGVSPIKNTEKQERENQMRKAWGMTYKVKKSKTPRKLFSIEETVVVDSGYSDRSGVNSRATAQRVTPSPTSSVTPPPTLKIEKETTVRMSQIYYGDQPYVLKSFYV